MHREVSDLGISYYDWLPSQQYTYFNLADALDTQVAVTTGVELVSASPAYAAYPVDLNGFPKL